MRILVVAFFFVSINACVGARAPFFRQGYVYSDEFKSFYKVQLTGLNWTEANHSCKLEGASLAVADSRDEAAHILNLVRAESAQLDSIYTGLQDILSEGVFTTSDGKSIEDVYEGWASGEPKSSNTTNCVTLDSEGELRVVACGTLLPYVCKKTLATLEWNTDCNLPDLDYKYSNATNKCYKFHLSPQTWTEAFRVCLAEESYLAVINSFTEASVIANVTNDAPIDSIEGDYLRGAILLGFHNKFEKGYETIFGESLESAGYALWGPGQPDSAGGAELCGSMFYELERDTTSVFLNDIGCDAWKCFFICEHDLSESGNTIDSRIINNVV